MKYNFLKLNHLYEIRDRIPGPREEPLHEILCVDTIGRESGDFCPHFTGHTVAAYINGKLFFSNKMEVTEVMEEYWCHNEEELLQLFCVKELGHINDFPEYRL